MKVRGVMRDGDERERAGCEKTTEHRIWPEHSVDVGCFKHGSWS